MSKAILAFVISFDSYAAVEGYLVHPVHDEVVKLAGELASRVDVFCVDA
ncbi:Dabb family protein [Pseudonocardia xinjiangensis]